MDETALVECKCERYCGPSGEMVTYATRLAHTLSSQRWAALHSTPTSTTSQTVFTDVSSGFVGPDALEPLRRNRPAVMSFNKALEEVYALQRTYRRLSTTPIDGSKLEFGPYEDLGTQPNIPSLLVKASPRNKAYFQCSAAFEVLRQDVDSMAKTCTDLVQPLVEELARDVRTSITQLEELAKAAFKVYVESRITYQEEGQQAEVLYVGACWARVDGYHELTRKR